MITCGNKIEGRGYLLQQSVPILFLKPGHSEIGSVSHFASEATTLQRKVEPTVLVVNDMPDQVEMMAHVLRKSGYGILTAVNGREGFEVAQAEHPDLVISDVSMPIVDGIDMCGLIREQPELSTIPILLVSAVRRDSD